MEGEETEQKHNVVILNGNQDELLGVLRTTVLSKL
jgi:hypothetical protein